MHTSSATGRPPRATWRPFLRCAVCECFVAPLSGLVSLERRGERFSPCGVWRRAGKLGSATYMTCMVRPMRACSVRMGFACTARQSNTRTLLRMTSFALASTSFPSHSLSGKRISTVSTVWTRRTLRKTRMGGSWLVRTRAHGSCSLALTPRRAHGCCHCSTGHSDRTRAGRANAAAHRRLR